MPFATKPAALRRLRQFGGSLFVTWQRTLYERQPVHPSRVLPPSFVVVSLAYYAFTGDFQNFRSEHELLAELPAGSVNGNSARVLLAWPPIEERPL